MPRLRISGTTRLAAAAAVAVTLFTSTVWAKADDDHEPCDGTGSGSRACVLETARTLLRAYTREVPVADVPFDPWVAVYDLGAEPRHQAGGDAAARKMLAAAAVDSISAAEWAVDGEVAFVSYAAHTKGRPTDFVAMRVTLRGGRIWEVMRDVQHGRPSGTGTPNTPIVEVTGTPAVEPGHPDFHDAFYCTDRIAEHGDDSMSAAQHRSCMIAIASTYVDGEENSAPGNWILFDPRFSRYSLGGAPDHQPSNSDLIRTQEGRYQGTYNRVIRDITHREWTVDGDTVWIVYDGYLLTSTTHPGFHVAERFTIRNGLIWEIMIAPVQTTIP